MPLAFRIAALALLACGLLLGGPARAVVAEPMDLDAEVLAKLAKEKAKATSLDGATRNAGKRAPGDATSPDCGSINIGNVTGTNRIGFAPTDVQVVIVGDVINANNKCK